MTQNRASLRWKKPGFEQKFLMQGEKQVPAASGCRRFYSDSNINFHLYAYAGNSPVKYTDLDGRIPCWFGLGKAGWSHHAPQRVFGYFDIYDALSIALGFNINGTKLEGNDFTVRMWKGNYGLAGAGGEIGLYKSNGFSMNRNDLSELGIISTEFNLIDNDSEETLVSRREKKPSFWTTGFNSFKHKHKSELTAIFTIIFDSKENAMSFFAQIKNTTDEASEYYWNDSFDHKDSQSINVHLSNDDKSVKIIYGNGVCDE